MQYSHLRIHNCKQEMVASRTHGKTVPFEVPSINSCELRKDVHRCLRHRAFLKQIHFDSSYTIYGLLSSHFKTTTTNSATIHSQKACRNVGMCHVNVSYHQYASQLASLFIDRKLCPYSMWRSPACQIPPRQITISMQYLFNARSGSIIRNSGVYSQITTQGKTHQGHYVSLSQP